MATWVTHRTWSAALTALALLICAAGCAGRAPDNIAESAGAHPDQAAALVSLAEAHHKRADIALKQGQRSEAMAEMDRLMSTAEPLQGRSADSHDIVFDAATRLARMHLEDEALAKAEAVARRGLADEEEAPPTLFRGYLHQVLAEILEKKGDMHGAVDEHGQAIEIFKAILGADNTRQAPPQPKEQ